MTLKLNHKIACDAGLTLVEVLIAMSIFVISFLVLVDTQNISLRNSAHSKRMTTATLLAQEKLSEMTLKYKGKSLSEIPEKEEGKFENRHGAYRWEETSRDFKYDLTFLADMAQAAAGGEEEGGRCVLRHVGLFIARASRLLSVHAVSDLDGTAEVLLHAETCAFIFIINYSHYLLERRTNGEESFTHNASV